jgi:hypothetical protein
MKQSRDNIRQLAATPEYRQQLEKQAFEPLTSGPAHFPAFVKAELEKLGKVIKAAGVKPEQSGMLVRNFCVAANTAIARALTFPHIVKA